MYNRYVRNDRGVYTRIPEDIRPEIQIPTPPRNQAQSAPQIPAPPQVPPEARPAPENQNAPRNPAQSPLSETSTRHPRDEKLKSDAARSEKPPGLPQVQPEKPPDLKRHPAQNFRRPNNGFNLFNQFHLDSIDTGDLLLLTLLFLLSHEHADEEVLAAIGLLLIL